MAEITQQPLADARRGASNTRSGATPAVPAAVFAERRRRVGEALGTDAVLIVAAATETPRNHDVDHEFRQASWFWWLTGFAEPDAIAVLTPGGPDGDYHLFVRPRDPERELWDGRRAGVDGARARFGADTAHEVGEFGSTLGTLVEGRRRIVHRLGGRLDSDVLAALARGRAVTERLGDVMPTEVVDPAGLLEPFRQVKDDADLASLRRAGSLAAEGHREAMRLARPGVAERTLSGALDWVWRAGGSPRNGYPSIVASGANACILHYTENDGVLADGDLVLIDAGCEVDQLSADITRTFPANGRFGATQRALYDVVLAAQRAAIDSIVPGATVKTPHETARRVLVEGLVDLGLVPTSAEDALAMALEVPFFMHGTSHWLGLDVHDVGTYRDGAADLPLVPGMALTVEPGLYVSPDRPTVTFRLAERDREAWMRRRVELGAAAAKSAEDEELADAPVVEHPIPEEFLGLGIRIEDDVVVTPSAREVLTDAVPVDPDEIEMLWAEAPRWVSLPD